MNDSDSLEIKNEFENTIDNLMISDNKEKKFSVILINSIFILCFLFVLTCTSLIVRNYYKTVKDEQKVEQIVNVKVIEMDGSHE